MVKEVAYVITLGERGVQVTLRDHAGAETFLLWTVSVWKDNTQQRRFQRRVWPVRRCTGETQQASNIPKR